MVVSLAGCEKGKHDKYEMTTGGSYGVYLLNKTTGEVWWIFKDKKRKVEPFRPSEKSNTVLNEDISSSGTSNETLKPWDLFKTPDSNADLNE